MKIGITGASGQLGTGLVRHALARTAASNIVGITRNPAKLAEFGIDARAGDFSAAEGLAEAFRGIERLVIVPTGDLVPGVREKQHSDAIAAAVKAGVQHITYISTVSPRPDPNNALFDSHFKTEQALIGSGAQWTILRMSVYADMLAMAAKGAIASGAHAQVPGAPAAYVVRDDIAAAAAGILTTPGHIGITYHATGPLSMTQKDLVDTFAKVSGKTIAFKEITPEEQVKNFEAMGLPPVLVSGLAGFQRCLREGAFDLVTGDVARLAGKPAESVEAFLKRALAG